MFRLTKCSKGYTLIETIISLGLIFTIVFAVSALALGYSRYQTNRLERSLVQENFRYTVSIIAEEIQQKSWAEIAEPKDGMSFELYMWEEKDEIRYIIRYHVVQNDVATESQVFRTKYVVPNNTNYEDCINDTYFRESEPVSDKIKAVSQTLFSYKEGLAIFITGKISNGDVVTYVSLVFPRN